MGDPLDTETGMQLGIRMSTALLGILIWRREKHPNGSITIHLRPRGVPSEVAFSEGTEAGMLEFVLAEDEEPTDVLWAAFQSVYPELAATLKAT